MNPSGDLAETLHFSYGTAGTEVMIKLTGLGAKNLAALLYRYSQGDKRLKGAINLNKLLKSGDELTIVRIDQKELAEFKTLAKKYGVLFSAVRDTRSTDGMCDVFFKKKDYAKVEHVVGKMNLTGLSVDKEPTFNNPDKQYDTVINENGEQQLKKEPQQRSGLDMPSSKLQTRKKPADIPRIIHDIKSGNIDAITPENWKQYLVINASMYAYSQGNLDRIFDEYVYDEVTEKRTRSVLDVFLEIYSADVATLLANLCCQRGRLPQGAPTSPMLSNIVFYPLDKRIEAYCRYNGIAYTRYSDDMTFSGDFDVSLLLKTLRFILQDGGFALNDDKTRVLRRGQRQSITGIVANKKLQVPTSYRKRIRQDMYYLKKFGVREHIQYRCRKQDRVCMRFVRGGRVYVKKYMQSVLGKINFVLSVNPKDKEFRQYKSDITFMLIVHKRLQTGNIIEM